MAQGTSCDFDGTPEDVSALRREGARHSLQAFAETYLPHHFSLPPCRMHFELADALQDAVRVRGSKIAIAAPRGHAKSTIVTLAYCLWAICYSKEQYIALVSDTSGQASDNLRDIKEELVSNTTLRMDFPGVCEPPGARPGPPRWRDDEIITRNQVKVIALGSGQKLRGRRHDQHRPTLVILDDVENDQQVMNPERREKLRCWFERTVLKAGTMETNFIVVGTVLHNDSLLANLLHESEFPGWEKRLYKAVIRFSASLDLWKEWEAIYCRKAEHEGKKGPKAALEFFERNKEAMLSGTEVLWPEKESYYFLMAHRLDGRAASFDCEKQNSPGIQGGSFPDDDLSFWDPKFPSAEDLSKRRRSSEQAVIGCDPGMGIPGRDYSAIVVSLIDDDKDLLRVLVAEIERRTPDQTIQAIIRLAKQWRVFRVVIEANQFQTYLADQLESQAAKQGVEICVIRRTTTQSKESRIASLQPLVKQGKIQFGRQQTLLLEQLRHFPYGKYDDGPDALALTVEAWKAGEFSSGGIYYIGPDGGADDDD